VTAAQVAAARDADPYLAAVLAEMGQPDDPAGRCSRRRSRVSRPTGAGLGSLLDEALITVKVGPEGADGP
jgi:hypothetical protein